MIYESFTPTNKDEEKQRNSFFRRFVNKINNQNKPNENEKNTNFKFPHLVNSRQSTDPKVIAFPKTDVETNSSNLRCDREIPNPISKIKRHSTDIEQNRLTFTRFFKSMKTNIRSTLRESADNLLTIDKLDRGYWMPDSICHKCYNCEEEFTTIKRRHHCRMCGQIFCYYCCSFYLPGSLWKSTKPQRSCRLCFLSYYSKSGTQEVSPTNIRSHRNPSIHTRSSKGNISPRGSIASEDLNTIENNPCSLNRNLSFSSNDIHYMSDHNSDSLSNFNDVANADSKSENGDDFVQFNEFKKSNISEIEEVPFERKVSRKISLHKAYQKYFFSTNILSKEKLFGNKSTPGFTSTSQNVNSLENLSNQTSHKRALLSIWKLIIHETELNRRNCFSKTRSQCQLPNIDHHESSNNNDANELKNTLEIIVTGVNSSKSCTVGHSLVNWIIDTEEVPDRLSALAICQSYMEMQLIYPYFEQDGRKLFKDDATLYVIREFLADSSPNLDSNHLFKDSETQSFMNSASLKKSIGNSTFYVYPNDLKSDDSENPDSSEFLLKSPTIIHPIQADNFDEKIDISFSQRDSTFLWNRSCRYLERLMKQELHDYSLDASWCQIILPICKVVCEKIMPHNNGDKLINDIRNFIQIKKIPNSQKNDCRVVYSVVMTKNVDFPMNKEIKNPNVILIRSSIDYWRHRRLVSLEPLLLQEEEYLKNCVIKIKSLGPDIVVVEGTVSLIAKDMMQKCGLVLVSNVRKEQIERLARMLGASIYDSVDSLGANVQFHLGRCSQFSIQKYTLTNGRNKYLVFFKLFNSQDGCTLLLHGKSLSELVRVKYILKFILLVFKNAHFELACLRNFKIKVLPSNNTSSSSNGRLKSPDSDNNNMSSTFLDIIENRCIPMSINVHYSSPTAVLRGILNPELQNRLLSLEIINLSWKEKLNDVLKRKQRHICAELYDMVRMNTRKHPLMCDPELHVFTNCFPKKNMSNKEHCVVYTDFRTNGSRFHTVNSDLESMSISTVNFDNSDLAYRTGFLTKAQEIKWRNSSKKRFESITDSFNPRNYQRILMLYSIQTNQGICEKPRKISLNYYETNDRTLGNFVSSMLNDINPCSAKCDLSIFEHVYKFISNSGCVQVSLHQLEIESRDKLWKSSFSENDNSTIKLWNWCSRCDKSLPLQSMSDDTWHLSLGRFFDLIFNLNTSETTLFPAQCLHSLQTDIHYYFTLYSTNKALEFKYFPIKVYEFQTPLLLISYSPPQKTIESSMEMFKNLQTEISKVAEIKTKYNLEIKEKICKLKSTSKEKDNELWDFLKQDSNTEQYSQKIQELYNLMENIYSPSTDSFNSSLLNLRGNHIKDEINRLWSDVVNMVTRWDTKLSEAFEKEDRNDKRVSKTDAKHSKNPSDANVVEIEGALTRNSSNVKLETNVMSTEPKDIPYLTCQPPSIKEDFQHKMEITSLNFDKDKHLKAQLDALEIPFRSCSNSVTSNDNSFENIDEVEILQFKKEKTGLFRDSDPKNTMDRQSSTSTPAMQPLRKLFPSLFNPTSYKMLDDPISPPISYSFFNIETSTIPVCVSDDSITSNIAYALSSDQYQEMLNDSSVLPGAGENDKIEFASRVSNNQTMKLISDSCNIESLNVSNSASEKTKSLKLETTKDREPSVRYFAHADPDNQSDNCDPGGVDSKLENEDIKIEMLSDDNLTDDINRKSQTNLSKPTNKASSASSDFIIHLNNHKVKCVCKIYNAKQFHDLRQLIFQNDDSSYIRSLSECKCWATTGGKSGSTFRKTLDDRFIIKQLHMVELEGFRKFHAKYFRYISDRITNNQKCALAKILGVYHVDYNNSLTKVTEKLDFLVMENVFYNQKPSRIFDLKGNKHGGANITSDKANSSDNSVMQDKDFINYTRSHPLYVSWQAQIALKETLTMDTDFLQDLPVMDYSLLVGVDDENEVLAIGIIDYLRMFTMNKLIEMHFKQKLLTPHGELPTVIQPQRYQKRFLEAMEEYFLVCPIPWDHLLLYPSNSNPGQNFNKKPNNLSFCFSSIFPNKSIKSTQCFKRNFDNCSDENQMRLGCIDNT